jgi:hypothetical protein
MDRIRPYLGASNAQVVQLYELEERGVFDDPNPIGEDFVAERMADAVAEIRDLVVMAWTVSETMPVGFPAVTLAEVEAGADPTIALFGRD